MQDDLKEFYKNEFFLWDENYTNKPVLRLYIFFWNLVGRKTSNVMQYTNPSASWMDIWKM